MDCLGGFGVVGIAVGTRMAWYLMGLCITLSGSGGWCKAWRESSGKSCNKKKIASIWENASSSGFHGQAGSEGGVGLVLLLKRMYGECCLFINYLK